LGSTGDAGTRSLYLYRSGRRIDAPDSTDELAPAPPSAGRPSSICLVYSGCKHDRNLSLRDLRLRAPSLSQARSRLQGEASQSCGKVRQILNTTGLCMAAPVRQGMQLVLKLHTRGAPPDLLQLLTLLMDGAQHGIFLQQGFQTLLFICLNQHRIPGQPFLRTPIQATAAGDNIGFFLL